MIGKYKQKASVGLLAAGIGLSIISGATAKDQQQYDGKPDMAEVAQIETNDPVYDCATFFL